MARQVIKLDLAKENPPMHSRLIGQTAYIQGLGSSAVTPGKNPQPMFVENALPTTNGWQSIGFNPVLTAALSGFDEAHRIQDSTGAIGLLSPAGGRCYQWKMGDAAWVPKFAAGAFGAIIPNAMTATVGNQSFLSLTNPQIVTSIDPALKANLNAAQTTLNTATLNAYHADVVLEANNWAVQVNNLLAAGNSFGYTQAVYGVNGWGINAGWYAAQAAYQAVYNAVVAYRAAMVIRIAALTGGAAPVVPLISAYFTGIYGHIFNFNTSLYLLTGIGALATLYTQSTVPLPLGYTKPTDPGIITATNQFNIAQAAYSLALANVGGANGNLGMYQLDVANVANWKQLWMYTKTAIQCTLNSTVNITRTIGSFTADGWVVGMVVSGSGVPTGATITAVSALSITLSVATTLTGTTDISVYKADGIAGLSQFPGSYSLGSIKGFVASGNYLIAYDSNTIYWCSLTDTLDFTPSLITGAASAVPTDLVGNITVCYPITNGFLIMTTEGVLSAQYSGSAQYPWIFKAVGGSGPVIGVEALSHDLIDSTQIGWTTAGLCTIDANSSTLQEAEISDFLKSDEIESFDTVLNIPINTTHVGQKVIKVSRVSARYVVISYGLIASPQIFTHAIVYDTVLKRSGKIVTPHAEVFLWPYAFSATVAKIAILRPDGTIDLVDPYAAGQLGCLIFGRIAITRNSLCTVQYAEVEGCNDVRVMPLLDGVTMSQVTPMVQVSAGVFNSRVTAKSHNLLFKAPFDLIYAEIAVHQAGSR